MSSLPEALFLTTSGQVGGAERCLLSLCAELPKHGYDPAVLIGSPGPLAAMLGAQGVDSESLPLPARLRALSRYYDRGWGAAMRSSLELPSYIAAMAAAVRRRHPAVLHSNGLKMHYLSALLAPWLGVPLLWHLHDFPADVATAAPGARRPPAANRLLAALSFAPDLVIANSDAVALAHAARFPRLAPKLRVVHNGVDVAAFAGADGGALRRRLAWAPTDMVIGMVAIFAPWKGQEVFLRAARAALEQLPDLKFLLVGDDVYDTAGHGGQRAALVALASQLGLGAALRFTGFLGDDIASAYAALDIMVHASTRPEPFGRTLIEAMAARVAVIAASGGGVGEIITDGLDGCLTPPGDVAALARAMLDLATDAPRRRALAAAGLATVTRRFSAPAITAAVASLYDEARARHRRKP